MTDKTTTKATTAAAAPVPATPNHAATPDGTAIPGGGSWAWSGTGWVAQAPDQPTQQGEALTTSPATAPNTKD